MKNLLYKEFRLAMHPSVFFFLLLSALLLIPAWPFFIAFGYLLIGIMSTFFLCRANLDVFFTVMLPVPKRDVVRARVGSIVILELLQILTAVPFAVLHNRFFPVDNVAGMNINFAFFGFVFGIYAVFNLVFLPGFYKTAYKVGGPVALASVLATLFAVVASAAVAGVPVLTEQLNGLGTSHLASQLWVLIGGIVLFAAGTGFASRVSQRRFERVDL